MKQFNRLLLKCFPGKLNVWAQTQGSNFPQGHKLLTSGRFFSSDLLFFLLTVLFSFLFFSSSQLIKVFFFLTKEPYHYIIMSDWGTSISKYLLPSMAQTSIPFGLVSSNRMASGGFKKTSHLWWGGNFEGFLKTSHLFS